MLEKLKLSRRKIAEALVKINERQEVLQLHPPLRMTPIIMCTGTWTHQRHFFFTAWSRILSRNRWRKMQISGIDNFCWLINAEVQGLSRFWDSFQSVNYSECAAFGKDNNITFRKEVLEQKVTTILGSLNYSRKVKYKVLVIS